MNSNISNTNGNNQNCNYQSYRNSNLNQRRAPPPISSMPPMPPLPTTENMAPMHNNNSNNMSHSMNRHQGHFMQNMANGQNTRTYPNQNMANGNNGNNGDNGDNGQRRHNEAPTRTTPMSFESHGMQTLRSTAMRAAILDYAIPTPRPAPRQAPGQALGQAPMGDGMGSSMTQTARVAPPPFDAYSIPAIPPQPSHAPGNGFMAPNFHGGQVGQTGQMRRAPPPPAPVPFAPPKSPPPRTQTDNKDEMTIVPPEQKKNALPIIDPVTGADVGKKILQDQEYQELQYKLQQQQQQQQQDGNANDLDNELDEKHSEISLYSSGHNNDNKDSNDDNDDSNENRSKRQLNSIAEVDNEDNMDECGSGDGPVPQKEKKSMQRSWDLLSKVHYQTLRPIEKTLKEIDQEISKCNESKNKIYQQLDYEVQLVVNWAKHMKVAVHNICHENKKQLLELKREFKGYDKEIRPRYTEVSQVNQMYKDQESHERRQRQKDLLSRSEKLQYKSQQYFTAGNGVDVEDKVDLPIRCNLEYKSDIARSVQKQMSDEAKILVIKKEKRNRKKEWIDKYDYDYNSKIDENDDENLQEYGFIVSSMKQHVKDIVDNDYDKFGHEKESNLPPFAWQLGTLKGFRAEKIRDIEIEKNEIILIQNDETVIENQVKVKYLDDTADMDDRESHSNDDGDGDGDEYLDGDDNGKKWMFEQKKRKQEQDQEKEKENDDLLSEEKGGDYNGNSVNDAIQDDGDAKQNLINCFRIDNINIDVNGEIVKKRGLMIKARSRNQTGWSDWTVKQIGVFRS